MKMITLPQINRLNKKLVGLFLISLIALTGFSQNVSINSTGMPPNASAGLDVDFPNMGILIPRVALTGTVNFAPLSAHVAGMVIYNTATTGDVTPGFYYNSGTGWIPGFPKGSTFGNMLYWNGAAWVLIPAGLPGQYLQMSGTSTPTWGGVSISTLSTTPANAITSSTALTGGTITSDGGSPIISRGVCWKTTSGPTIADSKTSDGSGIGNFISNISSLSPVTTYYVKAYAINSTANVYGNEISFTTPATLPTIASTTSVTGVTQTTASSGGLIFSDGGSPITAKGVCWSLTPNPTLNLTNFTSDGTGITSFSSNITGLTSATIYYVRAYATNSVGTSYAPVDVSFTTLGAYTVGQNVGYGWCVYVDATGQHGIIVSPDIAFSGGWGCSGTNIVGTVPDLFKGSANTDLILAQCTDRPIAASVARDYRGGGFSDWCLPTYQEWDQIVYFNWTKVGLSNHAINNYYSSYQVNNTSAGSIFISVPNGYPEARSALKVGGTVNNINYIRAVRYF